MIPKDIALKEISALPDNSSWEDILAGVYTAAVKTVPAEVYHRALEVLNDKNSVNRWLVKRNLALGDISPITMIMNNKQEEVMVLLGQIEYGVYT